MDIVIFIIVKGYVICIDMDYAKRNEKYRVFNFCSEFFSWDLRLKYLKIDSENAAEGFGKI